MLNAVAPGPKIFRDFKPIAAQADFAFANLEVPLTDAKKPTTRKTTLELKRRTQFILKASPKHSASLAASGLSFVTLGNNHCMDYGPGGLKQDIAILDALKIGHSGAGDNAKQALEPWVSGPKNGVRIGILSALCFQSAPALRKTTPARIDSPGVAVLSFNSHIDDSAKAKLGRLLGACRKQCDILIVAPHWGIERKDLPNAYQVALGRALVDAGADVVWGNHPHVFEGAEIYKGKPILYSTGNLVSPLPGASGAIRLQRTANGEWSVDFIPFQISGGAVHKLNSVRSKAAKLVFKSLCKELIKRYPSSDSRPAL